MAVQGSHGGHDDTFDKLSQAQFDPVQFLNDALPPLTLTSQGPPIKSARSAVLQSTSTDIQSFLSKLNTHSVRASSELAALTDEILRSGNRLAYEVEVLRGDANSLYELLTDALKDDILRFVFDEMSREQAGMETNREAMEKETQSGHPPDFIQQLRVLGLVKSRLEAVIHIFGEALKWPIPPSEVSMASLISVSAPELGVVSSPEDDAAREYTRKLRSEIVEALDSSGGGATGLDTATKRVDDLRALSQVWKGTAEEKVRTRIVDNLTKLVEDRRKALDARSAPPRSTADGSAARSSSMPNRAGRIVEGSTNTAAGLFRNLQKLRDEIYQD